MVNAGNNIRQIAQSRKKQAIGKFTIAGVLFTVPVLPYLLLDNIGISIFIHVGCWIYAFSSFRKGQKLLVTAQRANQGAEAEESVASILSELEREGWTIEYNIPLKLWGDADAFLRSPQGNCFVVDTKSDGGTVFFNGTVLMKRYGKNIHPFSNNKDILKAARGQAVTLKEMKGVRFVTPILCFTKATLDIQTINNKVENVYILTKDSLVRMLIRLDK
jgi:hypothetical protein